MAESGYSVEVAYNGTDGLHAAANGDHDLVILDVMLPGIDGFAVLIRSTSLMRYLTMKQQSLAMAADQSGYEQYRKPTRRDEFLATMESIVP